VLYNAQVAERDGPANEKTGAVREDAGAAPARAVLAPK